MLKDTGLRLDRMSGTAGHLGGPSKLSTMAVVGMVNEGKEWINEMKSFEYKELGMNELYRLISSFFVRSSVACFGFWRHSK
jgi:hypothetical protein